MDEEEAVDLALCELLDGVRIFGYHDRAYAERRLPLPARSTLGLIEQCRLSETGEKTRLQNRSLAPKSERSAVESTGVGAARRAHLLFQTQRR